MSSTSTTVTETVPAYLYLDDVISVPSIVYRDVDAHQDDYILYTYGDIYDERRELVNQLRHNLATTHTRLW